MFGWGAVAARLEVTVRDRERERESERASTSLNAHLKDRSVWLGIDLVGRRIIYNPW